MPKALLRIDAHIEAATPEELKKMIDELSVWGNHDHIYFDHIEVEDDSEANPESSE